MAGWSLFFTRDAQRDFGKLDKKLRLGIAGKIEWLKTNFNETTPAALGGDWRGYFKLRAGDWRVIYKVEWDKNLIVVYAVGRRDKVYKRR